MKTTNKTNKKGSPLVKKAKRLGLILSGNNYFTKKEYEWFNKKHERTKVSSIEYLIGL